MKKQMDVASRTDAYFESHTGPRKVEQVAKAIKRGNSSVGQHLRSHPKMYRKLARGLYERIDNGKVGKVKITRAETLTPKALVDVPTSTFRAPTFRALAKLADDQVLVELDGRIGIFKPLL